MSKELIPVNVLVGDRTYRLKIEDEDEEILRKTVKLINDKINEFKLSFAGKDTQDYLAMVLIWLATEQQKETELIISKELVEKQLTDLTEHIDKHLSL